MSLASQHKNCSGSSDTTLRMPRRGSAGAVESALEEAGDEPTQRGNLAGLEVDGPAQRHREDAEARHLLRCIGAFGGAGAEPLEDGAAELLNQYAAHEIDGTHQPSAADEPAQQVHRAGKPGALAIDFGDLANETHRAGGKQ